MEKCNQADTQTIEFSDEDRHSLYKTIFNRRDVRGQFQPTPIPDDVLSRVLQAAHHAPSVGFMQPWDFLLIKSQEVKQTIHKAFLEANAEASTLFPDEKQATYRALKLEGILESPLNICITCDRQRSGPAVIGRTHIKTMDLYSSVCAVQNLWLAARAEGLGLGWVSIIKQDALKGAKYSQRYRPHRLFMHWLCLSFPHQARAGNSWVAKANAP